jgi:PD-(D/E)XK nuclease superfamily
LSHGGEVHAVEPQKKFPVFYQTELIGNLTPDLTVDGKMIVDPKVVAGFNKAHVAQMIRYLTITPATRATLRPAVPPRLKICSHPRYPRNWRFQKSELRLKKNPKKSLSDPRVFR